MHGPLIEASHLDCHFGPRAVLSAIDLVVAPGEVHGLLGPRGAGKTTLLRVLAGTLEPSSGRVSAADPVFVSADDPESLSPIEANLNTGTRRRITLVRALAGDPKVALIDEPRAGVDAETVAATRALAARLAAAGGAVVWATRRLDGLHGIASGVTLLAGGRVRYRGSVEALTVRALAGSAAPPAQPLETGRVAVSNIAA
jgi:ABC-type multidrug transport system ATPase subunit